MRRSTAPPSHRQSWRFLVRGTERPLPTPSAAGATSLERRLPLVMTGMLAAGLTALLAATYETLTHRETEAVRDRLQTAAREIASNSAAALPLRTAQFREVARDPALLALLTQGPTPAREAAAREALDELLTVRDTILPAELWDADGRVVAFVGPPLPATMTRPAPTRDSVTFTPFTYAADRTVSWTIVPVRDAAGTLRGHVAQVRATGGTDAARTLRGLTGQDVTAMVYNRDGTGWTRGAGGHAEPQQARDSTEAGVWGQRPGVGRVLVAAAAVSGTPWVVSFEVPERAILARPMRTMRTLGLLSLAVIAVGGAISWAISRRITRPLTHLTDAAEELARGTYEHPVAAPSRDEVGRLAASFDAMARQVVTTRQELERRAADAQAAADALQVANARLRRTGEEAERARAEADRANRAKSDFLAMMSHELRTPLNAIGGYAELIELGIHGPVTDAQREALLRIGRSQAHLLTLINDVLSFARIDAGQVQYAIEDVALHEALAGLEALVAPQVRARGLIFDHRPSDPALQVRADRDKLRQLVLNLLGNAIKYTPDGGTVTLACDADDAAVRVHVRDTGVGIPADRMPSIFEAFVQGERALNRPNDGVGLGLAISRELAHGMGGTLTVESAVGEGSTFTLTLARAREPRRVGTPPHSAPAVA
jgi:signal transduction histidine kinase